MFRYFGSKASTSAQIAELVGQLAPLGTIADAFGGLGTIGAELRSRGHKVTTCDVLTFPHFFQVSRIECNSVPKFHALLDANGMANSFEIQTKLNKCYAPTSWFVTEFSKKRKFFTYENAVKIAGAWHQIVRWNNDGLLNKVEKAFLVSSLLNSMDLVANTAGTYYAYLKDFNRKALRPFRFDWLLVNKGKHLGTALHGDACLSLQGKAYDVLYLDPPYNDRNYAAYYHLPESLALLTKPKTNTESMSGIPLSPHVGAQNIRDGMSLAYLEKIITNVGWNSLIVHYCDGALIPLEKMAQSLRKYGRVEELQVNALGYTTKKIARLTSHHVFVVTPNSSATTGSSFLLKGA